MDDATKFKRNAFRHGFASGLAAPFVFLSGRLTFAPMDPRITVAGAWRSVGAHLRRSMASVAREVSEKHDKEG